MKAVGVRMFGVILSASILQGIGTVNCLYAEYPSWGSLWKHWRKDGGITIPNAYKRLSDLQKAFEKKEKNGTLSEEDKKKRLRFFWEIKANGEVFERPPENVRGRIWGLDCFRPGVLFANGKKGAWKEEVYPRIGFEGAILPYIRFINVVASKQFLIDVLTRDFVTELDGKCGGIRRGSMVYVDYIFYPIHSEVCYIFAPIRSVWCSADGVFHESYRQFFIDAGVAIPQRVSVRIKIAHGNDGVISDRFCVSLELMWNTLTDEIEKVELVDRVIVNEPVFNGRNGTVLFEKK